MRAKRGTVRNIIIALVIAFVAVNVLGYLSGIGYTIWEVKKGKQRQMCLLCETDFQILLEACRELSRRVITGDLKPDHYGVRLSPHPEASSFPQPILDLKPTYVSIDSKRKVTIELHGGFYHCGVMAYPEDYKYDPNLQYGEKQLIPGLWYYDDDYRDKYPKHQKKIDALIQKGKMRSQIKDLEE